MIKKVFIQRKTELEHAEPTKSSVRIRYETLFFLYIYIYNGKYDPFSG